jgi:hypothetical protein
MQEMKSEPAENWLETAAPLQGGYVFLSLICLVASIGVGGVNS